MANDQSATVKVALPDGSGRAVYHIKPHDTVDLRGLDLGNTRIDLLGADMVLTNTKTHATVVLAQLALYLFSKDDAPTILGQNGKELSPEAMLSHVGKVWEFTARDYLGITSLEKTEKDPNATEEGGKNGNDKADASEAAAVVQPAAGQFATPAEPRPLVEDHKKFDQLLEAPIQPQNPGQFSIPPKVTTDKVDVAPETAPPQVGITFTFDARMLQTGVTKTNIAPGVDEVRGGGAFETGVFDDRNTAQFSQEIIDVSAGDKGSYVIYADNPDYFTDTTATRVMQLTPFLPDGFLPSKILIAGLPVGYSIIGATNTADGWLLTNPSLNANGAIDLPIVYPTGTTASFSLTINFTAAFDASTGTEAPATGEISYTLVRDVDVKTVGTPADGNYIDANGHLVWVLAQNENSTKILAGDKTVTIYGGKGVDDISSGAGDDTIYGAKGNDIISTGGGNDFIQGGAGDDTIVGGSGIDTADYTDKSANVSVDLSNLTNGAATVYVGGVAEDTLSGIENLNGGTGNDTLTGDSGANVLNGGDGNDTLMGRGGNDTLSGGNGTDTVSYAYADNAITIVLNSGAATVNVATGDVDTLSGIENITGSNFADTITGDANANVLLGGGGKDTFYFSDGADVIDGQSDIDSLILSTAGSGATLDLGTVNGGGYSTLTVGATTQTVKGIENVTGTAFGDTLTGNGAANVLRGEGGNDTIDGGDGNDTIYGGTGSDTLHGGLGSDTLSFDDLTTAVAITMSGAGQGSAVSNGNTDTFDSFETIYMTAQGDTFTESTGADVVFGLAGNDTFLMLAGDNANDTFDGGTGVDTLNYGTSNANLDVNFGTGTVTGNGTDTVSNFENAIGGSGDDTFRGTFAVANTFDGGSGTNSLSYDYITTTSVVANFSSVNGSGYATITNGTDSDLVKNIQNVTGGGGADTFTGNSGGMTFNGGAGNDTFNASAGNDTFNGGADVDTVNYGIMANDLTVSLDVSGNASATFAGLAKTDTLTGIENILGGGGNDTITGNDSANTLRGGGGNDVIHGGNGNDTISGGDGNDSLYGDAGDDFFNGDLGDDLIDGGSGFNVADYGTISGSINVNFSGTPTISGATVGTDTLTNIQKVIGGTSNDTFTGSSGNDNFDGGGGFDNAIASAGNDTYVNMESGSYAAYSAKIIANMATGVVQKDVGGDGSIDYTDNYGTSMTQISTGSFDDTVTGSNVSNNINTGLGNDTIIASRGNDTLNGSTGSDLVDYSGLGGTINANLTLATNTVFKSIDSTNDSVSGIEKILAGNGNDTFQTNGTGFSSYTNINGGGGTDTIAFTSGAMPTNVEAANFANVFDNMEVFDLRNATLSGGDSFQMNTLDIIGLTASSRTLDVYIKNGFNLALSTSSGYTLAGDSSSGNTRTITYTKNGETNVTLHVMTYS